MVVPPGRARPVRRGSRRRGPVGLCRRFPAAAAGPTITGSGSSYRRWRSTSGVAQVEAVNGDNINSRQSSSVTGLNEFAQQQVDFGATEMATARTQAHTHRPPAMLPVSCRRWPAPPCMDYNVPNPIGGQQITSLQLTTAQIMGIFTDDHLVGSLATGGLNGEAGGRQQPIVTSSARTRRAENYILSTTETPSTPPTGPSTRPHSTSRRSPGHLAVPPGKRQPHRV